MWQIILLLTEQYSQKELLHLIHDVLYLWEQNLCSNLKKSQMLHFVVESFIQFNYIVFSAKTEETVATFDFLTLHI